MKRILSGSLIILLFFLSITTIEAQRKRKKRFKFKKGDNIILAAFGGGFTWGSVYLKWAY